MIRYLYLFVVLFSFAAHSQKLREKNLRYCTNDNSIGTGTFDPVSYFKSTAPKTGNRSITEVYDGVTYYFESEANRILFKKNPTQYLPQFGGWCSMTLAMGKTTRPTYSNYLVENGKLYLFERTLSVNGKELWLKAPKANYESAVKNYKVLK